MKWGEQRLQGDGFSILCMLHAVGWLVDLDTCLKFGFKAINQKKLPGEHTFEAF